MDTTKTHFMNASSDDRAQVRALYAQLGGRPAEHARREIINAIFYVHWKLSRKAIHANSWCCPSAGLWNGPLDGSDVRDA